MCLDDGTHVEKRTADAENQDSL